MGERLYDEVKDRRYGALFFKILAGCLLGTYVVLKLRFDWREEHEIFAGSFLGLVIALLAVPVMRRLKPRDDKKMVNRAPLSSDEIRSARSKLKRQSQAGF